jgi:hypothetical protein
VFRKGTPFDRQVFAFNETAASKFFQESHVYGHIARLR